MQVPFDAQAEWESEGGNLGKARVTQLGGAKAEIGQAVQGIAVPGV